jgi:hypothetical protein
MTKKCLHANIQRTGNKKRNVGVNKPARQSRRTIIPSLKYGFEQQPLPRVKQNPNATVVLDSPVTVGDLILKPFPGHGTFEGRVVSTKVREHDDPDPRDWYTVVYEDGDVEVSHVSQWVVVACALVSLPVVVCVCVD